MKVSLIQMNSQDNKAANLAQAESLITRAVEADRPDLIALPEMFTYLGTGDPGRRANAETLPAGESYKMLKGLAQRHRVHIHGGSIVETAGDKLFNTTVVFDPTGNEIARYRKIHLFDVTTPDGKSYRESDTFARGTAIASFGIKGVSIGCTICYDLRFPELYQRLAVKGVKVILVPAAFTKETGKDHWEVLIRARAIETECYVLAPAQCGTFANGTRATWGHSMIVGPWGHIMAQAQDQVGFITATLDFAYLDTVRANIPVASHKVL
ncbi:MAG: carbon-nitrogen hydrolase family protein [Rhodospirillales bacterium]|nr:carbon-nitrogen hydrolase family protein [Rhodospirillales bacterium]